MLEDLLLFYLKKDLPSMLAQFGQAKVGQNEDVLSTKVQLSLELLDLHLAELHAFRFFALERFPVLQVSTFSQQESTSLSLALTRLLQLFQRHLDEIAQFRKTCRGIDKLQKCDIFCGIADDMQDHVLMLAAKITVAQAKLPYRWVYRGEEEGLSIVHYPNAEWSPFFSPFDSASTADRHTLSPNVRPFEKEAHLEAEAYAWEVLRMELHGTAPRPKRSAKDFAALLAIAKQKYLAKCHDAEANL